MPDDNKEVEGYVPQDKVNGLVAEERRKTEAKFLEKIKAFETEVENLKKAGGNTTALTAKIEELNNAMLTKEELAKKKMQEEAARYEAEQASLKEKTNLWETKYKATVRETAVRHAAMKHDAFDPFQLDLILAPKTRVVEKTDNEGKGTGDYEVVTAITIDGKELVLPVDEAVEKMRGLKQFANQFKAKGQPGLGLTLNNLNGSQGNLTDNSATNPADAKKVLAELRKQGKIH